MHLHLHIIICCVNISSHFIFWTKRVYLEQDKSVIHCALCKAIKRIQWESHFNSASQLNNFALLSLKREIIQCLIGHCHLLLGISMHNDSLPGDWTFFYFLFHVNQHKSDVSVAVICFADFTSSRKHHDVSSNCFHVIKSLKSVSISYNVFLEILEQTISLHFVLFASYINWVFSIAQIIYYKVVAESFW